MKTEKIKTISIIILSVLLVMSVFTQVLFSTLLGITSVASLKQVMLAKELISSSNDTNVPNNPVDNTPNIDTNVDTNTDIDTPSVDDSATDIANKVLIEAAGVKVTFIGFEYDDFWESYKVKFAIENNSADDVLVTSTGESVDGFMVDTSVGLYCEVLAGKKAVDYLVLYGFELEPYEIDKPSFVDFKLEISDAKDIFKDIATSGNITLNFV